MQIYTFTTPLTMGGMTAPLTVESLQMTGFSCGSFPGSPTVGALSITLTDPGSGFQTVVLYQDSTVPAFWQAAAVAPATGDTLEDTITKAIFAKLVADAKVPPGVLSTFVPPAPAPEPASAGAPPASPVPPPLT